MGDSNVVVEKSLRSVFVGNIPYDATEEKLRDIFGQVGPVMSFKLMYDRESGKPKGYGFCEYKDQETALSAMRNLNAFEIAGRPLRVDNACTEKSRMEMQTLMQGPIVESPYGPDVDTSKAPEAISNAVASLPPEQMYELMRQMKLCVRNNPAEARTMLMSNPQLAYALLQAQVVMRIIDPKMAVQILHGARESNDAILPSSGGGPTLPGLGDSDISQSLLGGVNQASNVQNGGPQSLFQPQAPGRPMGGPPPGGMGGPPPGGMGGPPGGMGGPPPAGFGGPPMGGVPPPVPPPQRGGPPFQGGDFDHRQMINQPGGPPPSGGDHDMRMPPMGGPRGPGMDTQEGGFGPGQDFEGRFNRDGGRDFDQRDRFREGGFPGPDGGRGGEGRPLPGPGGPSRNRDFDFRSGPPMDSRDPRGRNTSSDRDFRDVPGPPHGGAPPNPSMIPSGLAGQDQEKASLIMQVLQLSDEQIQMLPPEQQSSIMQLKEQIQKSTQ